MPKRATSTVTKPANVVAKAKIIGAYKQMLKYQFLGTGILVALIAVILVTSYITKWFDIPLLLLVVLAGMLGAFFSALTRLYNVDQAGVVIFTSTVQGLGGGPYLFMYSFVPPIVGTIAALVLYLIFVAGYLHGDLFPEIACKKDLVCVSMQDIMDNYSPKTPQDYGKALVWAFIAGFSERLVPNILQSLASRQQTSVKKL